MQSKLPERQKLSVYKILCICFGISGIILTVFGSFLLSGAYREYREMSETEHIRGEVVELDIEDSYIHAVVEYTVKNETHQVT